MPECKQPVGRGTISFLCDEALGHEGPCASQDNMPSKAARQRWLNGERVSEAPVARSKEEVQTTRPVPHPGAEPLGTFQGAPKTFETGLVEAGHIPTVDTNSPNQGRELRTETRPLSKWDEAKLLRGQPLGVTIEDILPPQPVPERVEERPQRFDDALPPTKQRNGDQPLPRVNDGECIQDLVIDDIQTRKQVGVERYGTTLQSFNGRNVERDLYEELLDATMYARQQLVERGELGSLVIELYVNLAQLFGEPIPPLINDLLTKLYEGLVQ